VVIGRNGDTRNDEIYDSLGTTLFKNKAIANYKHLCGEYPVSSSFGLWLAVNILKNQTVPEVIIERGTASSPKKILIYNHYLQKYHSLMLVSALS
jgi:3-oxoacyl-[acyl-carrier-protein] synthase II